MAYYKLNKKISLSFWDPSQKEGFDEHVSNDQVVKFDKTQAVIKAQRAGRLEEATEKEYNDYKKSVELSSVPLTADDKKVLDGVKNSSKKIIEETNAKAKEITDKANEDAGKIIEDAKAKAAEITNAAGNGNDVKK